MAWHNRAMEYRIKKILRDQKLTQTTLSDRTGISAGYLSEVISGKKTPSQETLQKIAQALDVRIVELYEEMPQPQRAAPGMAESDVAPVTRDDLSAHDLARTLCPAMRHPALFIALKAAPAFGIFCGDMLLVDLRPTMQAGQLVLANTVSDHGAQTGLFRLVLPWLIGSDPTDAPITLNSDDTSINATVCAVIRTT